MVIVLVGVIVLRMLASKRYVFEEAAEKFSQTWMACAMAMVQGDLSVLTVRHALIAAKTGTLSALIVGLIAFIFGRVNRWVMVWALGAATMAADLFVHPTHFGPSWMEAAVTSVGAMALAVAFDFFVKRKKST